MNLADNLKKIRKENQLSQEQLAEKLGVSRQSVSKWESGQSYPEMDKVLQICQIFHLNLNELINENLNEVTEKKKEKDTLNKVIDSFFNYITKVVNLFSSFRFRDLVKCLFEQVIVIIVLLCIFCILGMILYELAINIIFYVFPISFIGDILNTIYTIVALILGVAIFLHIFKIRYLDYYEVVVMDDDSSIDSVGKDSVKNGESSIDEKSLQEEVVGNDKKVLERKKEKIIVRDPKHSEYGFIKGLFKLVLLIMKFIVFWLLVICASFFIFLFFCFVVCFSILKSGLLFVSIEICILGMAIITYLFILLFFNFIFNRSNNHKVIFISFIVSLLFMGVGIGLGPLSIMQFEVLEDTDLVASEYEINMENTLTIVDKIHYYGQENQIEYIVSDDQNVKVVIAHSKYNDSYITSTSDGLNYVYMCENYDKMIDFARAIIHDLNNKKLVRYNDTYTIKIYTTEENIQILKDNFSQYQKKIENREKLIDNLNKRINSLEEENSRLNEDLMNTEEYLKETIDSLRLDGYEVVIDDGYISITKPEVDE